MYAKIRISGLLEVVTGLHIGKGSAFSAIGAVDSPVVRDALTSAPMIPGSSLKGKMRTLLARQHNVTVAKSPDGDNEKILRLFGSAKSKDYKTGRLLFSDIVLCNGADLRKRGVDDPTEIKFENTINRLTAEANPRQIERAIRGSQFQLELMYEVNQQSEDEVMEDFELISDGLKLLQYDYLGGHGSRGYGKISFSGVTAKTVLGERLETFDAKLNEILDMQTGTDHGA